MVNRIEVRLEIDGNQRADTPFNLRFIVTNSNDFPVYVLKAYTPLEGLRSDCLDVLWNGEPVQYDGPLLKRGKETARSYVLIGAGETIEAVVDISKCYSVSAKGSYEVSFKGNIRNVIPAEDWRPRSLARATKVTVRPNIVPTAFRVSQSDRGRATSGAIARAVREARESENKSEPSKKAGLRAVKAPKLVGGTATKRTQTKQAHKDGYNLCDTALSTLANDSKYRTWFGAHTTGRFNTVKTIYENTKKGFESTTFTYHLNGGSSCEAGDLAYTYYGSDEIWLCGGFWSAPTSGTDSKAGVVLHEHTHASADTEDHEYGQADCKVLAQNDPAKAIDNADNFEYHAGG